MGLISRVSSRTYRNLLREMSTKPPSIKTFFKENRSNLKPKKKKPLVAKVKTETEQQPNVHHQIDENKPVIQAEAASPPPKSSPLNKSKVLAPIFKKTAKSKQHEQPVNDESKEEIETKVKLPKEKLEPKKENLAEKPKEKLKEKPTEKLKEDTSFLETPTEKLKTKEKPKLEPKKDKVKKENKDEEYRPKRKPKIKKQPKIDPKQPLITSFIRRSRRVPAPEKRKQEQSLL